MTAVDILDFRWKVLSPIFSMQKARKSRKRGIPPVEFRNCRPSVTSALKKLLEIKYT